MKLLIPNDFNYQNLLGLKKDSINKLQSISPRNVEHASRIPGYYTIGHSNTYLSFIQIANSDISITALKQ